ncbi:MAG: hypothetical protein ACI4XH_08150, partial [Acutalibacteraceae bacterium]
MNKKCTLKKVLGIITAIVLTFAISIGSAVIIHDRRGSIPASTTVENGLSAYEIAVQYGYEGTVQEWLGSLEGKSAYEIAVENGYSGSESEWTASLKATSDKDLAGIKTAAFNADGQLVLSLSDGTRLNLGTAVGADGKDGTNGKDGNNGADGQDGKDGIDGQDGIGITEATINGDGELVIVFSNGESVNLDKVVGMNGTDGISVTNSEINTEG